MRPNPISLETAQLLASKLKMPVEHILHMPQHILLQKIAELGQESEASETPESPKKKS